MNQWHSSQPRAAGSPNLYLCPRGASLATNAGSSAGVDETLQSKLTFVDPALTPAIKVPPRRSARRDLHGARSTCCMRNRARGRQRTRSRGKPPIIAIDADATTRRDENRNGSFQKLSCACSLSSYDYTLAVFDLGNSERTSVDYEYLVTIAPRGLLYYSKLWNSFRETRFLSHPHFGLGDHGQAYWCDSLWRNNPASKIMKDHYTAH